MKNESDLMHFTVKSPFRSSYFRYLPVFIAFITVDSVAKMLKGAVQSADFISPVPSNTGGQKSRRPAPCPARVFAYGHFDEIFVQSFEIFPDDTSSRQGFEILEINSRRESSPPYRFF